MTQGSIETLLQLLTWPVRVAQARRDFAVLATMGERELRDIGLSGQDLRDAAALSLTENATHVLARRAKEREELALASRRRVARASEPGAGSSTSHSLGREQESVKALG
jgi:uncharacterized protein YjiS (DUF1127 family)